MEYFKNLTGIYFKPKETLDSFQSDDGVSKSFIFFLYSSLIANVLTFFIYLATGQTLNSSLMIAGGSFAFSLVWIFVFVGIFHLFVKMFGGINPYYQSVKAFAYISAFGIIYNLVNLIGTFLPLALKIILSLASFALAIWSLYLLGYALNKYTGLSGMKLAVILIILVVLALIFVLFVIGVLAYVGILSPENITQPIA